MAKLYSLFAVLVASLFFVGCDTAEPDGDKFYKVYLKFTGMEPATTQEDAYHLDYIFVIPQRGVSFMAEETGGLDKNDGEVYVYGISIDGDNHHVRPYEDYDAEEISVVNPKTGDVRKFTVKVGENSSDKEREIQLHLSSPTCLTGIKIRQAGLTTDN
ncbi:MAG: hypothetical protein K2L26_03995 [Duncaniella sp.]|nr:hypothetical protein [Duncaniella sp.]